jgi:Na+-transporting NADH:ubiquinone oxidoreductase subunit C
MVMIMLGSRSLESPGKVLQIALGIALVCALLVSFLAVTLRPYYIENLEAERMARLASVLEALHDVTGDKKPGDIEARAVILENGTYSDTIDPASFDARRAANDPNRSVAIPAKYDIAGIKSRAKHAVVYLLRKADGKIDVVILPVRGVGYQSALYGYLALSADANEILALKFYEHGETPGLGSQIQNPAWEAQWPGKRAFDESGKVSIRVGGPVGGDRVDAISGATRTSTGVDRLIRFWLSEFGFGPFLDRVRRGEA